MNISLLSKLWPLSSKQSLNDYTIKWYWKFRYSLLARKTFFPSVSQISSRKTVLVGRSARGNGRKKKFCCYLKKNFFLFLSQSFANWKKRWLKSLIREQWSKVKFDTKKNSNQKYLRQKLFKGIEKKSFLNFYWNKIVTSTETSERDIKSYHIIPYDTIWYQIKYFAFSEMMFPISFLQKWWCMIWIRKVLTLYSHLSEEGFRNFIFENKRKKDLISKRKNSLFLSLSIFFFGSKWPSCEWALLL
jgi:hypothetical protein